METHLDGDNTNYGMSGLHIKYRKIRKDFINPKVLRVLQQQIPPNIIGYKICTFYAADYWGKESNRKRM